MGVEDVEEAEDGIEVYTAPDKLRTIKKMFEESGFEVLETELQMKPKNVVEIKDPAQAKKLMNLIDTLENLDDVQKVFANMDIPGEIAKEAFA